MDGATDQNSCCKTGKITTTFAGNQPETNWQCLPKTTDKSHLHIINATYKCIVGSDGPIFEWFRTDTGVGVFSCSECGLGFSPLLHVKYAMWSTTLLIIIKTHITKLDAGTPSPNVAKCFWLLLMISPVEVSRNLWSRPMNDAAWARHLSQHLVLVRPHQH